MNLLQELDSLDFSIKSREHFASELLKDPNKIQEAIRFLNSSEFKYSEKLLAALEFTSRKNLSILFPFLDVLIDIAKDYSGQAGRRALSKIISIFIKDTDLQLNFQQKEKIIPICFDWLLSQEKVAVKVFSMEALYLLSTEYHWVKDDLKAILIKDYNSHSAGYKARARKILKKLE